MLTRENLTGEIKELDPDPDPHHVDADPQHWLVQIKYEKAYMKKAKDRNIER